MALQRCGVPQHLEDLGEGSGRDGDQGGARVHNGGAAAILAELHGYAIHFHGLDLDQPMAEVGMVDRSPSQRFVDMAPGPATNSQLASFLGVLGQEDREGVRGRCADPAGQARHDVGEVELGRLRQAGQAEAQDSVKLEILERLLGHLRGLYEGRLRAEVILLAQTESVAHQLPHDRPRADVESNCFARLLGIEGNVHLVCPTNVLCRAAHGSVVGPM
mmetsp:Transcript_43470/g.111926  ORF Transcript_43470/g.111926 Transcript_43470/m.111926 type:complete len:218 (+) Transcript_43470:519-1172(+)